MAQLSKRICVLVLGSSLLVGYGSIGLAAKQKSKPPEVSVTQGFSQDRLRRIAPVMQDQINKNMFPGAVTLVARNGRSFILRPLVILMLKRKFRYRKILFFA